MFDCATDMYVVFHMLRCVDIRSLEIVAHRECAVEAGQINGGKKVSSKPPLP